jgi:hypothetical protein
MSDIEKGDRIAVRDAFGEELERIALGPIEAGFDFPVVWACREEEWQAANAENRDPEGVPWPAEDVRVVQRVEA